MLMPENSDAWELFLACQRQLITAGFGSVVGIDESTLKWKMDLLEIPPEEQLDTLEKFQLIVYLSSNEFSKHKNAYICLFLKHKEFLMRFAGVTTRKPL